MDLWGTLGELLVFGLALLHRSDISCFLACRVIICVVVFPSDKLSVITDTTQGGWFLNKYKVFGKCCYISTNYCHYTPSNALMKFLLKIHYIKWWTSTCVSNWILVEMGTVPINPSRNCTLVHFYVSLTQASSGGLLISCTACSKAYLSTKPPRNRQLLVAV